MWYKLYVNLLYINIIFHLYDTLCEAYVIIMPSNLFTYVRLLIACLIMKLLRASYDFIRLNTIISIMFSDTLLLINMG
jgi:hypothetical protein